MNQLAAHEPSESVSIDPITLEVIRHGIISICDQIDANMTRTAFSPYIYEYKDYAVGFVSAEGSCWPNAPAACRSSLPIRSAWRYATAWKSMAETISTKVTLSSAITPPSKAST